MSWCGPALQCLPPPNRRCRPERCLPPRDVANRDVASRDAPSCEVAVAAPVDLVSLEELALDEAFDALLDEVGVGHEARGRERASSVVYRSELREVDASRSTSPTCARSGGPSCPTTMTTRRAWWILHWRRTPSAVRQLLRGG